LAKDAETGDLFEADGVTPKAKETTAITPEQLDAEKRAAAAEGKAEGLKEALKALPKGERPAPKQDKNFTRAELRAQVNEGKITEDQMDEILEQQLSKSLTERITTQVRTEVEGSQVASKTSDQIARYVDAFPDINKEGSALRAKVQAEFEELVANKSPNSLATELAAIKIACGPLKTGGGRRPAPDSHEDVGGNGDGAEKPDNAGWAKGLAPKVKQHYEKMILKGIYKGPADPKLLKEVQLARRAN
jgi:hypothetical protein